MIGNGFEFWSGQNTGKLEVFLTLAQELTTLVEALIFPGRNEQALQGFIARA